MSARIAGGRATAPVRVDPRELRAKEAAAEAAKKRAAADDGTWDAPDERVTPHLTGLLDAAREASARLRSAIERTRAVADSALGSEPEQGDGCGAVGDGRIGQIRSVLTELHENISALEYQITRLEAL